MTRINAWDTHSLNHNIKSKSFPSFFLPCQCTHVRHVFKVIIMKFILHHHPIIYNLVSHEKTLHGCNDPKKEKMEVVWKRREICLTIKRRSLASSYPTWTVRSKPKNAFSNGSRPSFWLIRLGSDTLKLFPTSFNSSKAFKVSMTTDMNQETSIIKYTSMKMWRKWCWNYQKIFQFMPRWRRMKLNCYKFWEDYNLELLYFIYFKTFYLL